MRWIYLGYELGAPITEASYDRYTSSVEETAKAANRYFATDATRVMTDYLKGRVTDSADDILLGCVTADPKFTGRVFDWMVANRLNNYEPVHPNCYLFFQSTPHYTMPHIQHKLLPFYDQQLLNARLIFSTLGVFWYRLWQSLNDSSVQARVKNKVVRVNVGCEWRHFTFLERPKQPRSNILHVSNLAWYKNPELLIESVRGVDTTLFIGSKNPRAAKGIKVPDREGKPVDNVVGIGPYVNGGPDFEGFIDQNVDFWMSTSRLDAQSTALLEMCARGLVPILTPQVGWESPHAVMLTNDPARNREIIERAVTMDPDEHRQRALGVRQQVERHHNWSDIYARINRAIARDQAGEKAAPDPGEALS